MSLPREPQKRRTTARTASPFVNRHPFVRGRARLTQSQLDAFLHDHVLRQHDPFGDLPVLGERDRTASWGERVRAHLRERTRGSQR